MEKHIVENINLAHLKNALDESCRILAEDGKKLEEIPVKFWSYIYEDDKRTDYISISPMQIGLSEAKGGKFSFFIKLPPAPHLMNAITNTMQELLKEKST